jgi:hypothetical protein
MGVSASHTCRFIPGGRDYGTQWITGLLGPTAQSVPGVHILIVTWPRREAENPLLSSFKFKGCVKLQLHAHISPWSSV